jgi:arginase
MTAIGLIGVPTSAGAFAPGQERAPEALRAAGLIELLRTAGLDVRDHGDRAVWRWRPDRQSPSAQNAEQVATIVRETADRVAVAASAGELTLVLGGDCTVGVGTVAGHVRAAGSGRVGLLYVDLHADLNVPGSVREGALDWMGMAHMLGEEGAVPDLAEAGSRTPLLGPGQVLLFAWGPDSATRREREAIERLGLRAVPVDEVAADPAAAARRARADLELRCDRLLVHFDVDTIDFTDTPLSEETGRNQGLSYQSALAAVKVILESPKLAGLTVTELNPAHVEEGAGAVRRLAEDLAEGLGAHALTRDTVIRETVIRGTTPAPATIRRATDSDADAVARLLFDFNTEYDDPTPEPAALAARVRELLAGGDTAILLADTMGEPAAVVVMRFRLSVWSPAKECYLAELYVVPALRGQGIGRALMIAAMDLARAAGADHMDLGTAETDTAARGLYESLGFGNREGRADGPVNFFYERELA